MKSGAKTKPAHIRACLSPALPGSQKGNRSVHPGDGMDHLDGEAEPVEAHRLKASTGRPILLGQFCCLKG